MQAVEVWADVPGWPRQVSNLGRVRSTSTGRLLKPTVNSRGYLKVRLAGRGSRTVYVHRLVAAAFCGPHRSTDHVDHIDFDRTNNAAANLRWLTPIENSVRWAGRVPGTRRNLWETPDDVPEDHVPMTEEERHALAEEAQAAGW